MVVPGRLAALAGVATPSCQPQEAGRATVVPSMHQQGSEQCCHTRTDSGALTESRLLGDAPLSSNMRNRSFCAVKAAQLTRGASSRCAYGTHRDSASSRWSRPELRRIWRDAGRRPGWPPELPWRDELRSRAPARGGSGGGGVEGPDTLDGRFPARCRRAHAGAKPLLSLCKVAASRSPCV